MWLCVRTLKSFDLATRTHQCVVSMTQKLDCTGELQWIVDVCKRNAWLASRFSLLLRIEKFRNFLIKFTRNLIRWVCCARHYLYRYKATNDDWRYTSTVSTISIIMTVRSDAKWIEIIDGTHTHTHFKMPFACDLWFKRLIQVYSYNYWLSNPAKVPHIDRGIFFHLVILLINVKIGFFFHRNFLLLVLQMR